MTLHDYYALCPRDGQMVTTSGTLCQTPSVDACRLCFPDRGLTDIRLRQLHIDTALGQIDHFIPRAASCATASSPTASTPRASACSPTASPNVPPPRTATRRAGGATGSVSRPHQSLQGCDGRPRRLGTAERNRVAHTLALHGSAAHQNSDFADSFAAALAAAPDARHVGPYARTDLARRIAGVDWVVVPSVWWENAPLVIHEAFQHRRPVICSDIGGMAEAVRDGANGLHAPVDDAGGLAETMRRAIETPGLWQRLADGIVPPVSITAAAAAHDDFTAAWPPPAPAHGERRERHHPRHHGRRGARRSAGRLAVAPGALLLLGWHRGAMPPDGIMQLERRRADRGPFRCLSWLLDDNDGPSGFLAAVRLPPATTVAPGQQMTLIEADRPGMVARLPDRFLGPDAFANAAADQGGRHGAALVQFVLQAFPPVALQRLPEVGAMLTRLLARVATADGCVELMGAVPDCCAFLQGWGRKLADSAELVLVGAQVTRCAAQIATFERPDIMAPATGVVLVLPPEAQAALPALDAAYLVTAKTILRRDVVERRLLSPFDSLGHVRDIVASLTCAPATADCLRRALRPPYEGRATLEEQPHPVRAAIDLAMLMPGAGAFVSGWLFDPLGVVDAVHLRGAGAALRLDEGWTRVQRPDVTDAMRGALPPCGADAHGFAVFAPARIGEGEVYLDIGFHDGTCGFLPVPTRPCDDTAARQRALEITDLHKPSGIEIIERQLGPLFQQLRRRPRPKLPAAPRPDALPHAIVVALDAHCVLPRACLSQFLHDPLDAAERLILVCDAAWAGGALDALRRLLAFCDLDALVLRAPEGLTATGALDLAMAASQAADFLLLSPDAVHGEPGWRAALRVAASRGAAPAVACPTLLYEDHSFRFAGNNAVRKLPAAPYLLVEHHLAGLPAEPSAQAASPDAPWQAQPATIGSLACCLVPAQVLSTLGGAQQGMTTPQTEERAFFLRLRHAGIACLWVPQARLHAPDSAAAAPAHEAVGTLVDNWGLRALLASEA